MSGKYYCMKTFDINLEIGFAILMFCSKLRWIHVYILCASVDVLFLENSLTTICAFIAVMYCMKTFNMKLEIMFTMIRF